MTKEQAAKAYLAALPPYRDRLFAFDNTVGEVLGSAPRKAVAIAKPLSEAITMLDAKLVRLGDDYPHAAADIKSLVTATAAFRRDLDSISKVSTVGSASAWAHNETHDRGAVDAASAIVRSDLELPKPSGLETAKL